MIVMNLDVMLAMRKMRSNELAERIGLTQANLSILKTGKAKAIRLSTLAANCNAPRGIFWSIERMKKLIDFQ